jgi:hypothetical protein
MSLQAVSTVEETGVPTYDYLDMYKKVFLRTIVRDYISAFS